MLDWITLPGGIVAVALLSLLIYPKLFSLIINIPKRALSGALSWGIKIFKALFVDFTLFEGGIKKDGKRLAPILKKEELKDAKEHVLERTEEIKQKINTGIDKFVEKRDEVYDPGSSDREDMPFEFEGKDKPTYTSNSFKNSYPSFKEEHSRDKISTRLANAIADIRRHNKDISGEVDFYLGAKIIPLKGRWKSGEWMESRRMSDGEILEILNLIKCINMYPDKSITKELVIYGAGVSSGTYKMLEKENFIRMGLFRVYEAGRADMDNLRYTAKDIAGFYKNRDSKLARDIMKTINATVGSPYPISMLKLVGSISKAYDNGVLSSLEILQMIYIMYRSLITMNQYLIYSNDLGGEATRGLFNKLLALDIIGDLRVVDNDKGLLKVSHETSINIKILASAIADVIKF